MSTADVRVSFESAGVQLLLDATDGQLPAVVHWGRPTGVADDDGFGQLVSGQGRGVVPNAPDKPLRLSVVPGHHTGWTGHPGLSGSRSGGRDWSPRFTVSSVTGADGDLAQGFTSLHAGAITFHATDDVAGLDLDVTVEMLPTGLVRARAAVTNQGDDDYRVDQLLVAFPVPGRGREVLDFAGRWVKERVPQRTTLQVGTHWREGRHGRTGADSAYALHLGEPGFGFGHGEIWSVHTAWSGNHIHYAERTLMGEQVIGGGELLLPGEGTLVPGATYEGPWIYANHADGLDSSAARVHDWLRSRPQHPRSERPVTLNVWEAVYFDHDADRLIDLAHRAAKLGVERYVLDDGWFGARRDDHAGLGDWVVSPDRWPDGLHPLVDAVTGLGMQFGLWFEPEMVNPDSDVARAHPEWIMQTGHRLPVESRHQQVMNLSIPGAYAHVRDQMFAILDEYDIAYIKWDHNRDLVDAGTAPGGEPAVHAQTEAYYRLVDELKAAHPGLEIESCSSGGARIDLEVIQRTDRVWVSDCIDPLERQQMNRWTAQLLPPELMGSHVASGTSHTTGRTHDINFRAATALFGHFGIEWDLAKATDDELSSLSAWIDLHKLYRPVLHGGRLVRGDFPDPWLYLHGVVTDERALYSVCLLESAPTANPGPLVLPGLEPDATYHVTRVDVRDATHDRHLVPVIDVTLTGRALGEVGVRLPLFIPDSAIILDVERV